MPQGPEHVTHQSGTAGTGLGDGGEDLLDIVLQVLLHGETAKTRHLNNMTSIPPADMTPCGCVKGTGSDGPGAFRSFRHMFRVVTPPALNRNAT